MPAGEAAVEKRHDALSDVLPVEDIASEHEVDRRWRTFRDVVSENGYGDAVRGRIEADRGDAIAVDLGGDHLTRPGLRGGNPDNAGASSQVQHAAARHAHWMVEDVAREHGAAGPGIGPVRRLWFGRSLVGIIIVFRIDEPPQSAARMGRVKTDFGKRGHADKAHVRLDEFSRVEAQSLIRPTIAGKIVIQGSPYSRSARRRILPTGVFGNSVLNSIYLGRL